ncbi:MAG: nuclear transport factor 2 family protein [Elusimicrobia bacterium]|nr:nuclear transport factor 2 family protein [Elusimicrobiota bacterium]MDE2425220.1 nuclear transport factor 2 family protein [Elusimicrobiota bacterium]
MKQPTPAQKAMVELFDKHVDAEMRQDLETTMATMTERPHLNNVPLMLGGVGREGVRAFYRDRLIGKFFPPDMEMTVITRTIGDERLVDEMVIRFTHSMEMPWFLPGVKPTGRRIEATFVVIVGVQDGKIAYEHIHWDHASVLVQAGLLDPKGLPVRGAEAARKMLEFASGA